MFGPKARLQLTYQHTKNKFDRLGRYSGTVENLLANEYARQFASEYVADIKAQLGVSDDEPAEPSDELADLRDTFPTLFRGSVLPFIHAAFDVAVRDMGNLLVVPAIAVNEPLNSMIVELTKRLSALGWSNEVQKQIQDYKHLRDACAHSLGSVSRSLYDPKRVRKAAERTKGVRFSGFGITAPGLHPKLAHVGFVELDETFVPAALQFHQDRVRELKDSLEAVLPSR